MIHRSFSCLLFSFLLPIALFGQKDSSQVRERALELFDGYKEEIEKSQDQRVKYRKAYLGHLNDDGMMDAVVEFGLGPEGGNKSVQKQIAVYVQQAAGLQPVAGIEPDFCPAVEGISDRELVVTMLSSCIQPEEEGTVRYVWNGDAMVKQD